MSGPSYDPNQPTPRGSSNTWIWIVLIVLLVLLLGCGGLCAGCTYFAKQAGQGIVQSAELFTLQATTMGAIQSNEEVSAKLGTVTGFGTPTLVGTYSMEQPTVACSFTINGENGEATATVTGTRESGALRPTDILVKFADGSTVNVPPGEYTPELNFNIESMDEGGLPADESMPADDATTDDSATPDDASTDDSAGEDEAN